MDSKTAEHSEEDTHKGKARPGQDASVQQSLDKVAEAKRAKKKQKRARHRARLRRPHTSG